jgi:DNA-binding response OmpR family regulator
MKILLLEDDQLLNNAIHKFLTLKGHKVHGFRDGESAKKSIEENPYDLLILDINVPHINGLTLCEEIQKKKIQIHTIFISAIIDIEDISRAFDMGCHDYLKKPFHLKELELRIDRLLQSNYVPQTHLRLSPNYSLDLENGILSFQGETQILSERHQKIMMLLAKNRNRVVDYYLFQEYAWDGMQVETPTIRAEINRLKKLLKEDIIVNIRNIGYMIKKPNI